MIELKDGDKFMLNNKLYRLIAPRGKQPLLKRIFRLVKDNET